MLVDDRAIDDWSSDELDRRPFIQNILRALVNEYRDENGELQRRATGLVVGLTGRWGLGKTSVLNLVAKELRYQHVAVAVVNPWLVKDRHDLLQAFFDELRHAIGKSAGEQAGDLLTALDRYKSALKFSVTGVSFVADHLGGLGLFSLAAKGINKAIAAIPLFKERTADEERKELEKKLKKHRQAVVVIIDDLDRVEDDEVRAVAQLIKAAGDIKGISYFVAYDPTRVADALGRGNGAERQKSGEAYLEKIIQHPIPLRPLFTSDVDHMLGAELSRHDLNLPNDLSENDEKIIKFLVSAIRTPREIKRLTGAYAVLEPMIHGEIRAAELLGYCWLLTKAPALRDTIADDFDKVVDDPAEHEMIFRILDRDEDKRNDPVHVLGSAAKGQEEALKLLFQRFEKGHESTYPDRISLRRNLVRLLYLGDPPGAISRKEVEAIWTKSLDEIQIELTARLNSERLPSLIDRLDDLLPQLSPGGDNRFFTALTHAFARDKDWLDGPNVAGPITDDAETYLMRLGTRNPKNPDRVKAIMRALIDDGDLTLTPGILRKHIFRHGFAPEIGPREGETIYDRDETSTLLHSELPRYRKALLDGTLLKRIPNLEALFCIKNTGNWDDELKKSLTDQLCDQRARATFAGQIVPPGYSTDRTTLAELFDADEIGAIMEKEDQSLSEEKTWLGTSVASLKRILASGSTFGD